MFYLLIRFWRRGESVATVAEETAHSELDLPDEGDPTEDMIDVESEDGTEPGDIAESIDTSVTTNYTEITSYESSQLETQVTTEESEVEPETQVITEESEVETDFNAVERGHR